MENRYPGQRIVWQEEGVEATVVVHERRGELSLTVNGNHEASTGAVAMHTGVQVDIVELAEAVSRGCRSRTYTFGSTTGATT